MTAYPDVTNAGASDALAVLDVPDGATAFTARLASGADRVAIGVAPDDAAGWTGDALDLSAFALALYADRGGRADVLLAGSPSALNDDVPLVDGAELAATFDGTRWTFSVGGTDVGPASDYTEAPPCRVLIGMRGAARITGVTLDGGGGAYAETHGAGIKTGAPSVVASGLRAEMREVVYAEIEAFAEARGLDLMKPNEAFESDEDRAKRGLSQRSAYLRLTILPTRPNVRGITSGWALHRWLVQVDAVVRDGVGDDAVTGHIDALAELLPMGRRLNGPSRLFQVIDAADVSLPIPMPGWFQTSVTVPIQTLE